MNSEFLIIALIVTNLAWLWYMDRQQTREKNERRELLNRKAEPRIVVPPDEVVKANVEKVAKLPEAMPTDPFDPVEQMEHAAVGQINPELARGDTE